MWFVTGLGNPGARYQETRHNAGFLVVDRLAERWGIDCSRQQLGALVGTGSTNSTRVALIKPQTFMNRSGHPTRSVVGYFKGDAHHVLVIHDDLELPFGTLRVKQGGGHGGHNGLRDLNQHLGADYVRLRFGISRPPAGWDSADYVLGKWTPNERDELPALVDKAADLVERAVQEGPAAVTSRNRRSRRGRQGAN